MRQNDRYHGVRTMEHLSDLETSSQAIIIALRDNQTKIDRILSLNRSLVESCNNMAAVKQLTLESTAGVKHTRSSLEHLDRRTAAFEDHVQNTLTPIARHMLQKIDKHSNTMYTMKDELSVASSKQ